jgi:predicted Zn-dependent peptidase
MKLTTIKDSHVTYQYIQTTQFKSRVITIRFFEDYDQDSSLARYLMFQMLKAKSVRYPSRKKISEALDALYDALLSVQSTKFGTYHVNTINLMVIHDKYTLEDDLFNQALGFLKALILEPSFDEKTLEEEKAFLIDMIKSDYANKTRHASKEYGKYLMAEHPYKGYSYGDIDSIDRITLDSINASYTKMIESNSILLSVTGDLSNDVHDKIKKTIPLKGIPFKNPFIYRHDFNKKPDYFNQANASQNRLFMALKTPIFFKDEAYLAMVVLVSLLGEGSDSILFKSIREAHSLAYYVYASYSPFSGIITLASGLDKANVKKAKALMLEALESLKNGTFKETDLALAKTNLVSAYKQSFDAITALSTKALRHTLFDLPFDETSFIEGVNAINKDAIIACAKTIEILFTYEYGVKL